MMDGEVARLLAAFNPKPLEGEFLELFYLPRRRPDREFIAYLESGSHITVIGDQGFGKTTTLNYLSEVALPPRFEPIRVQALYLADVLFQASVRALRRLASLYKGADDYISFSAGEGAQELESNPSLGKIISSLLQRGGAGEVRGAGGQLLPDDSLVKALRALEVVMQHQRNLLVALFTTVEEHVKLGRKFPPLASSLRCSCPTSASPIRWRYSGGSWALGRDTLTLEPFTDSLVREYTPPPPG